jgi:hypothetical protein
MITLNTRYYSVVSSAFFSVLNVEYTPVPINAYETISTPICHIPKSGATPYLREADDGCSDE